MHWICLLEEASCRNRERLTGGVWHEEGRERDWNKRGVTQMAIVKKLSTRASSMNLNRHTAEKHNEALVVNLASESLIPASYV